MVVNHALLLSDIGDGGRVLPPYEHLIIDEAHHLEGEATRQFGFSGGEREVSDLLERSEALRAAVRAALRGAVAALGPGGRAGGHRGGDRAGGGGGAAAGGGAVRPAGGVPQAAGGARPVASESQLLLNRAMRVQPDWSKVEVAWENLRLTLAERSCRCWSELSEALGETPTSGCSTWSWCAPRSGGAWRRRRRSSPTGWRPRSKRRTRSGSSGWSWTVATARRWWRRRRCGWTRRCASGCTRGKRR